MTSSDINWIKDDQPKVMAFIADLVTEDIREIVSTVSTEVDQDKMGHLLEALLYASIEAEEINGREVLLDFYCL